MQNENCDMKTNYPRNIKW